MAVSLPLSERNLILTGYTSPIQPLIGRLVGETLKMPIISVEAQIAERVGLSMEDIRAYYGETRLRSIEQEILDETVLRRHTVLRVSAAMLVRGDALERLRATGPVFGLITTLDAILQRLHIAMGARYYNPQERAAELSTLRREWKLRDLHGIYAIDTTYQTPEDTVAQIAALWQEVAIERL